MSLWADIDTYLEAAVMAEMGPTGLYSTLKIRATDIDDAWQMDKIKLNDLFPFSLIRGYDMTQVIDGFGDGELHTENTYPYAWVCAAKGADRRQAKRDAQELLMRMRKFLRKRPVLNGLVSTDTETMAGAIELGKGTIEVVGRLDQNVGPYYGMARLDFVINTTS